MGRASQRKGKNGELELAELLRSYGYNVQRGGSMTFGSVPDISGLPRVHIEVKRCEQLRLSDWMQQAARDAERFHDGLPAVFHRRNREQWLVTLRLDDFMKLYGGKDGTE